MRFWIPGALILATLIHLVQRAYQARRLAYGSTNLERVTAPVPKQRIGGRGCHGTDIILIAILILIIVYLYKLFYSFKRQGRNNP